MATHDGKLPPDFADLAALLGFALVADFERVADQSWLPKLSNADGSTTRGATSAAANTTVPQRLRRDAQGGGQRLPTIEAVTFRRCCDPATVASRVILLTLR
jgi:hypothetical protein